MKFKYDFAVAESDGSYVAVPVGDSADKLNAIIRLNETGLYIWKGIECGLSKEQIASGLVAEYSDLDYEHALTCVEDLSNKFINDGILDV